MIDVRKLLEAGHAAQAAAKAEKEKALAGHPRIGSVGAVTADGKVYGVCHRKALARSLGVEEAVETPTRIMWQNGQAFEDMWTELLEASGTPLWVQRHDEQEVRAKIPGVVLEVLGHPDIVLSEVGPPLMPVLGIEHKGVFSYGTASLVWFENRPKNENLIQAAAYSHFLNLPYELWYTSASYFSIPIYDKKKYGGGSIAPFYRGFKVEWRGDELWYTPEVGDSVKTPVTWQGIEDYFRLVHTDMQKDRELGPRVSSDYLDGTPNKWGADSDCKFCCFAPACAEYETEPDFSKWLNGIQVLCQVGKA